jgi:glutamate synthase domain-containing protein 2
MPWRLYCSLVAVSMIGFAAIVVLSPAARPYVLVVGGCLVGIAVHDVVQRRDPVRRNSPLFGHAYLHLRALADWLGESVRGHGRPGRAFARPVQQLIRERARGQGGTLAFGPQVSWEQEGHLSVLHSLVPVPALEVPSRVHIGSPACTRPYSASLLNISALSAGALSRNAIMALGRGAHLGGFYYNTGEGGLHPAFVQSQGDLVWQIGTAYFGCCTHAGGFDGPQFADKAQHENIKMIEVKLSQGAKPGHGGILLGSKVSKDIAESCGIPLGQDSICPPAHSEFATPVELLAFLDRLRQLSGGKPVGIKLCLGRRSEFLSICKAMVHTGMLPDFISVDGAEGGTGAAPPELANHVGTPLYEALAFVHSALVGIGIREHVRIIASGGVATGFDMVATLALGADVCAAARAFMIALGCMQSLQCDNNTCPTGITTQSRRRAYGIAPGEKCHRVAAYHRGTVASCLEILGAMGIGSPRALSPAHLWRRTQAGKVVSLDELVWSVEPGDLLAGKIPPAMARDWACAAVERF